MTTDVAYVGDIHGNVTALRGMWNLLSSLYVEHVVFLGDYINKGSSSAEVVQHLIDYESTGRVTLLAGNHEEALLAGLDSGKLGAFLKIGGAVTVRSYVGGSVGADVLSSLREHLPSTHLDAIRRMPTRYETADVLAQHIPPSASDSKFVISAHVVVGNVPRVTRATASIDTGCGTEGGRLTAFLWPSRAHVQVDQYGATIYDEGCVSDRI